MTPKAPLLIALASMGFLAACSKCPDGYEANDETKECDPVDADGDGDTDPDATDADADSDADSDTDADADADADADTDADTDADADSDGGLPEGAYNGDIETDEKDINGAPAPWVQDDYASILAYKAFTYQAVVTGGITRRVTYVSSSPGATCEDLAYYLGKDDDGDPRTPTPPFDPTHLFAANTCNVLLNHNNPAPGTYSSENKLDLRETLDLFVNIECAVGTNGSFQYSEDFASDGYYWLGVDGYLQDPTEVVPEEIDPESPSYPQAVVWYTARAVWGTLTRLDEVDGGVEIDLDLDYFDGQYNLLDVPDVSAKGSGKGTIFAEDCPDLLDTSFLQ